MAAQTQKAEGGRDQNGCAHAEGTDDDDRCDHIRQDMPQQDRAVARADDARRVDIEIFTRRQHRSTRQASVGWNRRNTDGNHQAGQAGPEDGDDAQRQQDAREREHHVHHTHQHDIQPAPVVTREESDCHTGYQGNHHSDRSDQK